MGSSWRRFMAYVLRARSEDFTTPEVWAFYALLALTGLMLVLVF
ncbi:hypothetical protein [Nibribacter ruber]|nr:hypothetical protein [Nibribacter ruber]